LKNFENDYVRLSQKKITVLHWQGFDSDRKRSTIIMQEKRNEEYKSESDLNAGQSSDENDGAPPPPDRVFIYSKGAPEEILKICDQIYTNECSHYRQFDQAERDKINAKVEEM
jgi:magnesium-transporting ATPase (P-type)